MYFSCFLLVLKKTCYGNTKLINAWKNRTFWSLSTCVWRGGATRRARVMTRVDSAPPQRQTFFSLPSVTLTLAAAADDQLRDARVHVDYSAAVERRGRWREETRRRVLQRERLPREVRVAIASACTSRAFLPRSNISRYVRIWHYPRPALRQHQFQCNILKLWRAVRNLDI